MQRQRFDPTVPHFVAAALHVYDMGLDTASADIEALRTHLSSRERAQAERFATPMLSRKYVLSHAGMRWVLAQYLGQSPSNVEYVFGQNGKPALAPSHATSLKFNLSHSGDKCLMAVSSTACVGIDVERVRHLEDWQAIAQRFFSVREESRLSALPRNLVEQAFFATWARKEAYIKALGLGLALDLSAFEVEVDPRAPASLLWALDETEGPDHWSMQDIDVGVEYRATVAVRAPSFDVERWSVDWQRVVHETCRA